MKPGPKPRPDVMLTPQELQRRLRVVERLEGLESLERVKLPAAPLLRHYGLLDTVLPQGSPHRRTLIRAQATGSVSAATADELCVKVLQLHPAEVFGEVWWAA